MPKLNIIRSTISQLPDSGPLVAVIPGGTTGIGSYIAHALARVFAKQGSKLRIYIVGRNASRADSIINAGKAISLGSDWRFIEATNLALLSEVDKACAEITRQEKESPLHDTPSIDLLYMTFCSNILLDQISESFSFCHSLLISLVTSEGLDSFLSTVYYARIRFIQQLIPLLTAGTSSSHAISVYAGGFEDGTKLGELPIGLPPPESWGITSIRKHTCFMKNFVFEELAQKHAGKLSLTHIYPGLVDGPGFYNQDNPTWFKFVWPIVKFLASLYMISPENCGDVMVYLATAQFPAKESKSERTKLPEGLQVAKSSLGESGGGCYAAGQRADVASQPIMYRNVRKAETSKLVWDHTFEVLNRVEKENAKPSQV